MGVDMNGINFQSTAPGGTHGKSVDGKLKNERDRGGQKLAGSVEDLGEKLLNKYAGDPFAKTKSEVYKQQQQAAVPNVGGTTGTAVDAKVSDDGIVSLISPKKQG